MDKRTEGAIAELRHKIRCITKTLCALEDTSGGTETDPIFSASPAFSILPTDITNWNEAASLMHEHANIAVLQSITTVRAGQWDSAVTQAHSHSNLSTLEGITDTLVTNWNTAFGWGNHASAGYVPIAGVTTITGAKTFNANITLGADFIPDGDNTRSIGSTTARMGSIYTINVSKGNTNNSFNLTTTGSTGIFFRAQPTTNNIVFQQAAAAPSETNYRVTIDGTNSTTGALLVNNGAVTLNGNTTISGQLTTNVILGTGAVVWGTSVTNQGITFRQGNGSQFIAGFQATTGNFYLQAAGTVPADVSARLAVYGTTALNGNVTIAGNILFDADGTRTIGTAALRVALFTTGLYKGSSGVSFNMAVTSGSDIYARFHATTHNLVLQSSGTAPTDDTGYRLQVIGKVKITNAPTYADNAAAVAGGESVGGIYKLADGSLKIVI